jgi:hypothetical protein
MFVLLFFQPLLTMCKDYVFFLLFNTKAEHLPWFLKKKRITIP